MNKAENIAKFRPNRGQVLVGGLILMVAEACGGNVPVTPNPTRTPEARPSPTPTLMETPQVTPIPTPSETQTVAPTRTPDKTASPTPEATPTEAPTPIPLDGIIDTLVEEAQTSGYSDVSPKTVQDKLDLVLSDPAVANEPMPAPFTGTLEQYIREGFTILKTGGDEGDRYNGARQLISNLYRGYRVDNNTDIYQDSESDGAIELALDFAYHQMSSSTFADLIDWLQNEFQY